MFDLKKYGFEPNITDGEWISPEGFIIYAGIGVNDGDIPDVELLTLQEFLTDSYEFRGTHTEMEFYLKQKLRKKKLKEILENE